MEALESFVGRIVRQLIEPLMTLVALAAFLLFLWGVVEYIRAGATGGKEKEDGRRHMIWGIVGLAIIFAANGIVGLIGATSDSLLP